LLHSGHMQASDPSSHPCLTSMVTSPCSSASSQGHDICHLILGNLDNNQPVDQCETIYSRVDNGVGMGDSKGIPIGLNLWWPLIAMTRRPFSGIEAWNEFPFSRKKFLTRLFFLVIRLNRPVVDSANCVRIWHTFTVVVRFD
jgi:hypothetical protein